MTHRALQSFALFLWLAGSSQAQIFQLPTANRALFEPGGGERFFVGTVGRDWHSGTFGCVRSGGKQMHEGIDIKCLVRDKHGEPTDPVMATANGTVAYLNTRPSLSNYGNYLILQHDIQGLEIFSTYAHLKSIRPGLQVGQHVKAGEIIATMGRTSNTGQAISKERAHVHFELNFFCNDRFPEWYKKTFPGQRNDHGRWNGQNLIGIDPFVVFTVQRIQGARFSLLELVRQQTELCRVLVRDSQFPWLKRCAPLVRRNPRAEREGIAGFEIALNYHGLPFQLTPRAASEIKAKSRYQLLSVNEAEYAQHPCCKLVARKAGRWELTPKAINLLDLLTY